MGVRERVAKTLGSRSGKRLLALTALGKAQEEKLSDVRRCWVKP